MRDCPDPQDLDAPLLMLAAFVVLVIAVIMWVKDRQQRRRARERQLIDQRRARQRADLDEEWQRWLREGRG